MVGGGFTATTSNPNGHGMVPFYGSYAFTASANANPKMYQAVDLSTYSSAIDLGTVMIRLEALAADTYSPGENPIIYVEFLDGSNASRGLALSPLPVRSIGTGVWRSMSISERVPTLTRSMRIYLWANRADGTNNNVSFDGVRAFITGN